ncbi:FYN-binding protein 1 [Conger conger]|uniref:FYN-binding protein 1 n=1 Tax=Conger conger TaxID=82655 RepID=UPI002A5A1CD6|nr:FYN-binding protein 1 [Conger conger]
MARFTPGASMLEDIRKGSAGLAVCPTPSPLPSLQSRRAALENKLAGGLASGALDPKPNFPKISSSSPTVESSVQGFPKSRALVNRIEIAKQDQNPPLNKQQPFRQKPLEPSEDNKPKPPPSKPQLKKPSADNILLDTKQSLPKPSYIKPPAISERSKSEDAGSTNVPASPKIPLLPKQKSSAMMIQSKGGTGESAGFKPHTSLGPRFSGSHTAQVALMKDGCEAADDAGREGGVRPPLAQKPLAAQNHGFVKRPLGSTSGKEENSDPTAPKKKSLPGIFLLGSPPSKPSRPPNVSLGKFQKGADSVNDDPGIKKGGPPPVPASRPGDCVANPLPPGQSLPHRCSEAIPQPDVDDNYDDVGVLSHPPPLPSGVPSAQKIEETDSDEEIYEDLDESWASTDTKEKAKKNTKEEKKRLEQEKREQKEREKKDLDIRKRFKLSGPIEVLHKANVRVDCKGGRNDLTVKQGQIIEIVRVLDNPGGRWLGRAQDGSYGYVKIESVEMDYDNLRRQHQGGPLPSKEKESPDLYDDVGVLDDFNSGLKGQAVATSIMPEEDSDYDDLNDLNLRLQLPSSPPPLLSPPLPHPPPPPLLGTLAGNSDNDIYDDVDSEGFPPAPRISNLPQITPKWKAEERDPKKQKRFEKEEKEFRKKFKFDGEIQVFYQVTTTSTFTTKKWGSKDLPLKPGEKIDVIVKPSDNKLIGRNQEGKIGYVSISNIITEDADIYDGGQGCIYDND